MSKDTPPPTPRPKSRPWVLIVLLTALTVAAVVYMISGGDPLPTR